MDATRFDRFVRALTAAGSRRRVLALLAALPMAGGLIAFEDDAATAKNRRKRRRGRHRRRTRKQQGARQRKKACKPHARERVCADKCGEVKNNCGKRVDCGPCLCNPACADCQTCDPGTAMCAPDLTQQGQPCGPAAQCAQDMYTPRGGCANGVCEPGTSVPCTPYQCSDNACATSCANDGDCAGASYCDANGQCVGDQQDGSPCLHGGQCLTGHCVDGVCCNAACGGPCDVCNLSGTVGVCTAVSNGTACAGEPGICCNNACRDCCDDSYCADTPGKPICGDGVCVPCSAGNPCPAGGCCDVSSGTCATNGAACDDYNLCTTDDTCHDGVCSGTPIACTTPPECQNIGTCDPETGTCTAPTDKPSGTACAGAPCGQCNGGGTCVNPCGSSPLCCHDGACVCDAYSYCRVSPQEEVCCCTNPQQICVDVGGGGSCQLPPAV